MTFSPEMAALTEMLGEAAPPLLAQKPLSAEFSRRALALDAGSATRAGLLIWGDDLESAHPLVQAPETPINNFWHAILHRREGDFSNARYWWRRTGQHPAMDEIFDVVIHRASDFPFIDELRSHQRWEPLAFTDWCEAASRGESEFAAHETALRQVQRLEIRVLFEWCAARRA